MTFYANAVFDIKVVDKNDVEIDTLTGEVALKAGDGVYLEIDGNELTINGGVGYSDPNSKYQSKYKVVIEGGDWTDPDTGDVLTFGGMPYYVASIAGVRGNTVHNYDFLSNACGQVGIFEFDMSGSGGSGGLAQGSGELPILAGDQFTNMLNSNGELVLLDLCQACVDCADYSQIIELMSRIEDFQNWDVKRNLNDAGEGGELALFHQYQSTVHYWNYLVHNQCIPLKTIRGSDQVFAINTGYFLKDCVDLTNIKQIITVDIDWCGDVGNVDIHYTNIIKRPETLPDPIFDVQRISGNKYKVYIDYPDMSYNEYVFFQLIVRASQPMCDVTVTSQWCNTHITIPIGASVDPPGDQCVTRVKENVI